jgi:hypothetical protein
MSALCPDCGEELDDFAPCACGLASRQVPPTTSSLRRRVLASRDPYQGGMRRMVARKLARQRGDENS